MSEHIKTGAEITNGITAYEASHEPSLNTKEYCDLVGTQWVSLSWLKEIIEQRMNSSEETDGDLSAILCCIEMEEK